MRSGSKKTKKKSLQNVSNKNRIEDGKEFENQNKSKFDTNRNKSKKHLKIK